jgi:hypothetical protein
MPEPLTLAVVGTVALTEGIKFLYGQAGEILKRWRERREKKSEPTTQAEQTEAVNVILPEVFEGKLSNPVIHFDALQETEEQLRELRKDLADYADGIEPVDSGNERLLQQVDALRQLLEAVYQQHLTFKGEQRPTSGPVVHGKIDVKQVAGYVAAVRAHVILSGTTTGEAKVERVEVGGSVVGVDINAIGVRPGPGTPGSGGPRRP